jgi:hypothetical protein
MFVKPFQGSVAKSILASFIFELMKQTVLQFPSENYIWRLVIGVMVMSIITCIFSCGLAYNGG